MGEIKASIIIPAYNEELSIAGVCQELLECLDMSQTEIIVVDDGSTDRTGEIAEQFSQIRTIHHRRNRGYGAAIRTGTKEAQGEIVAWYDSDGQHRPEDLLKVIKRMTEENLDYCICISGGNSYEEKSRKFGKWILRVFLRMMTKESIHDFNSGLRAFKRKILLCYLPLLPAGFGASTVTTLLMKEQAFIGGEVEITVKPRIGKSTVKQIRDGLRTMGLILNIIILFRPLVIFGAIGSFVLVASLAYGIYCALTVGLGIPVLSSIGIFLGLELICLGLISHQISSMRRENYYYLYENQKG
ncbi:MAG: glycosyltransferase family 2 protein [Lachnospiraceae bacterium]|nr:glycosyltransferase family 2 protein [Lachnospiraceae bacterium]